MGPPLLTVNIMAEYFIWFLPVVFIACLSSETISREEVEA